MPIVNDEDEDVIWRVGVYDAHCHPTDIMASIDDIEKMHAKALTVMATRAQDQHLVVEAANRYPLDKNNDSELKVAKAVVPAFGWHPWFSYQIIDDVNTDQVAEPIEHYKSVLAPKCDDQQFLESLPSPILLSEYLVYTEARLQDFSHALVGEIGLDRSFRLPYSGFIPAGDMSAKTGGSKEDYTPGSREGRPLSPYRVNLEHQKSILKAQFELAGKLRRAVSVHSVQTHGVVFDLLQSLWKGHEKPSKRQQKRRKSAANARAADFETTSTPGDPEGPLPYPPRICMHSYSGPPGALSQFLATNVPAEVYFSFSICINFSTTAAKAEAVIKVVPDDRILVESDLHCAGETMDGLLKEIVIKVCQIKGWELKAGAEQLKENWTRFIFGSGESNT